MSHILDDMGIPDNVDNVEDRLDERATRAHAHGSITIDWRDVILLCNLIRSARFTVNRNGGPVALGKLERELAALDKRGDL